MVAALLIFIAVALIFCFLLWAEVIDLSRERAKKDDF